MATLEPDGPVMAAYCKASSETGVMIPGFLVNLPTIKNSGRKV